jgi:GrpE.
VSEEKDLKEQECGSPEEVVSQGTGSPAKGKDGEAENRNAEHGNSGPERSPEDDGQKGSGPAEDESGESAAESENGGDEEKLQLRQEIERLKNELEEKDNRLLRVQADFDNYRKRIKNEMATMEKYKSQSLATDLLTTVDNFERALAVEAKSDESKAILKGMEMVYRGILEVFKKHGIEPIEGVGEPFDPRYHHAVMQEKNDNFEPDTVIEVFQKGYKLKDRVIRPAMVKVNE